MEIAYYLTAHAQTRSGSAGKRLMDHMTEGGRDAPVAPTRNRRIAGDVPEYVCDVEDLIRHAQLPVDPIFRALTGKSAPGSTAPRRLGEERNMAGSS